MIVLSCSNISKSYIVDKILDDINFSINHDEKVGLVGLNGAGKSTLFNILTGEISEDSGSIYMSKDCKLGYLEQQSGVDSSNTIFEEVVEVFKPLFDMENKLRTLESEISIESQNQDSKRLDSLMNEYSMVSEEFESLNGYGFESEIRGVLKGLGFLPDQFDTRLSKLSGGQKARVALAKILLEKPDILLLDEPTNHLDIEAIDWLEKYIRDYKGATIIISHDRYFLDNTVSKIFFLENSKLSIYNGNYTEFIKRRKQHLDLLQKKHDEQQKEMSRQKDIISKFMAYGGQRYVRQAQSRQKMLDKMDKIEAESVNSKKSKIRFEPKVQSGRDVLSVSDISKRFDDDRLFESINFNIYKGERVGLIGPNGVGKTTLFKIIMDKVTPSSGEALLGHQVNIGYYDQEQSDLNSNKTVLDEIWVTKLLRKN